MACRAQNPNHFWPLGIFFRPPCAISLKSWLMRDLNDSIFAACLTKFRRCFVPLKKPLNIIINNSFGFSFFSMRLNSIRVSFTPTANRFRNLFLSTIIRTKPFLSLIWSDRKNTSAISAFMLSYRIWPISPAVSCPTLLGAKFFRSTIYGTLYFFPTIFASVCFHEENIHKAMHYVK